MEQQDLLGAPQAVRKTNLTRSIISNNFLGSFRSGILPPLA
jgi:hypothetical protein